MNAIMPYEFPSQHYQRDYELFIKVEIDFEYASPVTIHATRLSHKIDNHLKVRNNTPHFRTVIIALQLYYKFG